MLQCEVFTIANLNFTEIKLESKALNLFCIDKAMSSTREKKSKNPPCLTISDGYYSVSLYIRFRLSPKQNTAADKTVGRYRYCAVLSKVIPSVIDVF